MSKVNKLAFTVLLFQKQRTHTLLWLSENVGAMLLSAQVSGNPRPSPRPSSKGKLKFSFAPHSIYHRTWYYCASCEGMKVCFGFSFFLSWKKLYVFYCVLCTQ